MPGLVPDGIQVPPGVDPMSYYLQLPAMSPAQAHEGADMTMTTNGPDQVWFVVVAILCITIPALFLSLRVYTRVAIVAGFELADYFLFLSFPLIIVELVLGYFMIYWGAGVHQWQVTLEQLFNQLYWANLAQVVYCPLCFLVKMAILLQYLKMFAPCRSVNRLMFFGAWATIIATFVAYVFFMFWTLFYCAPRKMIWFKLTPGGKCHDVNNIILSQGAFNMISDIVILLLPSASLWRLNVPLSKKIFVTLMFATGLLACVASAMRIVFTVEIAPVIAKADVSHNGLFIGLWTEAEASLGFIIACALCLPKLIQAKGKKVRMALTYASGPWSSKLRKSDSWNGQKSTQVDSRSSKQEELGRPMYYEEREEVKRLTQAKLQPQKHQHDLYVIPSTAGSSVYAPSIYSASQYSLGTKSKRWSQDVESIDIDLEYMTVLMDREPLSREV
ncbi:hypothetical protein HBI67_104940 [Parastagonospora nodorum]|nr:hypothetical protein HBI67_104940 [Parastagonospora nodorum]KAH6082730.1 hypothetical protein HBI66_057030 [Parastagonospora nodorum]